MKDLIVKYFDNIDWDKEPKNLYAPIDYALQSGGKRIRPMLVLMASKLFGGNIEEALRPAAAMEIFHNFTLLHDDVMDNADTRRKRETVYAKWGANTAILSGDAMLIKAYQFLDQVAADKFQEVHQLFSQTALEVCEGQQYDSDFETRSDVTIEEYYEMVRLKTAVLLAGCLKLGAILGNASKEDADYIYEFGIAIGIAFQLRDDYLDCYGDEKTFGKKIGGDILCGKRTFLLIKTLEKCRQSQRQTINQLMSSKTTSPEEKVNAIINIYTDLGMPAICDEAMNRYYDIAIAALKKINKSESEIAPFVEFAQQLMGRKD